MTSSGSQNESRPLCWVVLGNSEQDYRVLATSGNADEGLAELKECADRLARDCEKLPWGEFSAMVGVSPLPKSTDRFIAFRVFDTGLFYGRPHNIGVVAFTVGTRQRRTWQLGDLLAALESPKAGSEHYEFPNPELYPAALVGPPFYEINQWDVGNSCNVPDRRITFAKPIYLRLPQMPKNDPPPSQCKMSVVGVILLLVIIVTVVGGAIWLEFLGGPKPTEKPEVTKVEGYDDMKDSLANALKQLGVPQNQLTAGNPNRLASMCVDAASELDTRMEKLARDLDQQRSLPTLPAAAVRGIVEDFAQKAPVDWGSPTERADPPPHDKVERALRVIDDYCEILRETRAFGKSASEFNSQFTQLIAYLQKRSKP